MTDQQTAAKLIREAATAALKTGLLHSDYWAEMDDLLLDERPAEAAQLLAQHTSPAPVYLIVPGPLPRC